MVEVGDAVGSRGTGNETGEDNLRKVRDDLFVPGEERTTLRMRPSLLRTGD